MYNDNITDYEKIIYDEFYTSGTNECHRYGIMHGCDLDCPAYQNGKCELQDEISNNDLYG